MTTRPPRSADVRRPAGARRRRRGGAWLVLVAGDRRRSPAARPAGASCGPTCWSRAGSRRCCSAPGRRWPTTSTTPGRAPPLRHRRVDLRRRAPRRRRHGDRLGAAGRRRHRRALRPGLRRGPAAGAARATAGRGARGEHAARRARCSTDSLKLGYGRPRPPAAEQLIPETGFSLPSGHTVDATVVLGVLALVLVVRTASRRRRAAIVAAATVTITAAGAGRVYLGVHWATDVVTGWLLGAAWVALCAVVLLLAERTFHNPQGVRARGPGFACPLRPPRRGRGRTPPARGSSTRAAPGLRPAPAADHDGAGVGRLIQQRPQGGVAHNPRLDHHTGTALAASGHPRLERHRRVGGELEPCDADRRTLWPPAVATMSLQVCTAST